MTFPEKHITKHDLLEQIHQERAALEAVVARLSPDQMEIPGVLSGAAGEWTAKDLLAHIVAWEQRLLRWLRMILAGEAPEELASLNEDAIQHMNEQSYQLDRDRPLDEIRAQFHDSYHATLTAIKSTPEAALTDLERYPWRKGRPLWWLAAANTSWHYKEHREALESWLEQQSGPS